MLQLQGNEECFSLAKTVFIRAFDIWLALDEPGDCTVIGQLAMEDLDWLNLKDAQSFQERLFYWLLLRRGQVRHIPKQLPTEG